MKRSLFALALAGLLANTAFAHPTLTGDDTYNDVHLVSARGAPEMTLYRPLEKPAQTEESGIYSFNP